MKYITACALILGFAISLTACTAGTEKTEEDNLSQTRQIPPTSFSDALFNNQSGTFFNHLNVKREDIITSEFDIELDGDEATFLVIEAMEDMEAAVHYTYISNAQDGVTWGYYLNGSEDKTTFELRTGTETASDDVWTDETVELKQGMNVFYISGKDASCQMQFEVSEVDQSKISYVGMGIR